VDREHRDSGRGSGNGKRLIQHPPRYPAGPARLKILCRPATPTPGHPMPGAVVGVAGKREQQQ